MLCGPEYDAFRQFRSIKIEPTHRLGFVPQPNLCLDSELRSSTLATVLVIGERHSVDWAARRIRLSGNRWRWFGGLHQYRWYFLVDVGYPFSYIHRISRPGPSIHPSGSGTHGWLVDHRTHNIASSYQPAVLCDRWFSSFHSFVTDPAWAMIYFWSHLP